MSDTVATSLTRLALASVPVGIAYTLSWFGIFTFVNNFLVSGLGYSNEAWTAIALWYTGSMMLWPFITNEISAWLGRRWTVCGGIALGAVLFLGFAVARETWVFCLLLALMSLVTNTISAVWLPMVATAGGEKPGRALVLFNWVNNLIGASALIGGSLLIEHLGYDTTFALCAAVLALGAVGFVFASDGMGGTTPAKVVSLRKLTPADLRALVAGPFLLVMLCGMCMEAFNYHTVNQLWPNLARDVHALSDRSITTAVAVCRLPALVSLAVLGLFVDRVPIIRMYGFSVLAVSAGVFCMSLAPDRGTLVGCLTGYFVTQGLVWGSNSPALNSTVSPRLRDTAFTVNMALATGAVFLVGIVHNRLLHAGFALPRIFAVCSLTTALGGAAVLIFYSFLKRTPQPEPAAESAAV